MTKLLKAPKHVIDLPFAGGPTLIRGGK